MRAMNHAQLASVALRIVWLVPSADPAGAPKDGPPAPVTPAPLNLDSIMNLKDKAITFAIERGPSVLLALGLLVVGWIAAGWARKLVINALTKAHVEITLAKFIANVVRWAIIAFVIVTCLGTLGINTTSIAALVGAAGLAIGLALQGNLGNLASGILILIFRPFKVGDSVVVAGQAGVVDGIDLFTTNLDTGDNRRIIVPNGQIFGTVIENQTKHEWRRVVVSLPVSPAANPEDVRRVLRGAADRVVLRESGTLREPGPAVTLDAITPAVTWSVAVTAKTGSFLGVREALMLEVKQAVAEGGIGPAAAVWNVNVLEGPKR